MTTTTTADRLTRCGRQGVAMTPDNHPRACGSVRLLILGALASRPMSIPELMVDIGASRRVVTLCLYRLREEGRARRVGDVHSLIEGARQYREPGASARVEAAIRLRDVQTTRDVAKRAGVHATAAARTLQRLRRAGEVTVEAGVWRLSA